MTLMKTVTIIIVKEHSGTSKSWKVHAKNLDNKLVTVYQLSVHVKQHIIILCKYTSSSCRVVIKVHKECTCHHQSYYIIVIINVFFTTTLFTTVCTIASWHLIHSCHVGCLDWTWTRSVKIGLPYMTVKTSKQAAAMTMWTVHWNSLELNHYTPPLLLRIQRKTSYGCNKLGPHKNTNKKNIKKNLIAANKLGLLLC